MEIRRAESRDIPGMIELLYQVGQVHHVIRPDIFRSGALKYDETALEALLASEDAVPWYGQLMRVPQTIAYMLQINCWMEQYHVKIV